MLFYNSPLKESTDQFHTGNFKQFFKVMMQGCGREYCFCINCKNHPDFVTLTKQEASIRALDSYAKTLSICEEKHIPKSIQIEEIELWLKNYPYKINLFHVLENRIKEVFSSLESLNISFFDETNFKKRINDSNPRIGLVALDKFFALIEKVQNDAVKEKESLYSSIRKSLKCLFDEYNMSSKQHGIFDIGQLRFLLILMEIPVLFEFDFNSVFLSLLKVCLNLETPGKQALIKWLSTYDRESFLRILENFKRLIAIQIISNTDDIAHLTNLILFTKLLYEANKLKGIVSHESFYIDLISNEEDAREEYSHWLENKYEDKDEFTYLEFPWILNCSFKAKILEEESKYEMEKEIRTDLYTLIGAGLSNPIEAVYALQMMCFKMTIRRDNLVDDTLAQISRPNLNFKKPLKIKFSGEQGVDEGGVKKEFFHLLSKHLLKPEFGMFLSKEKDSYLWFDYNSFEPPLTFELTGMLLGLAIYNSVHLDAKLPPVVYKKLLDEPLSIDDLKSFDHETYQSLKHILEYSGDLENDLYVTFRLTFDNFGEIQIFDLKANGDEIFVNNENKNEYVRLYLDWYFNKSIEKQFRPFYRGFHKVVSGDAIRLFNGEELMNLICGSPHLDFEELESVAIYEDGYNNESIIIKYFWEIIHSFSEEDKRKFLMFTTGTDRAPIKGLSNMVFIISRNGPDSDILPSAHTCFNHLLLPEYSSKEKLREKLLSSIANFEGFGLF